MKTYFVEGLYRPRGKSKSLEPFAKTIFAARAEEAIAAATEMIHGGAWVEGPKVSEKTEEQRMRSLGAPELPGLQTSGQKSPAKQSAPARKPAPKQPAEKRPAPKNPAPRKPAPARPAPARPKLKSPAARKAEKPGG